MAAMVGSSPSVAASLQWQVRSRKVSVECKPRMMLASSPTGLGSVVEQLCSKHYIVLHVNHFLTFLLQDIVQVTVHNHQGNYALHSYLCKLCFALWKEMFIFEMSRCALTPKALSPVL